VGKHCSEHPQVSALRSGQRATHANSSSHPLTGVLDTVARQSRSHATHCTVSREAQVLRSSHTLGHPAIQRSVSVIVAIPILRSARLTARAIDPRVG
jgi:hypothetical protein